MDSISVPFPITISIAAAAAGAFFAHAINRALTNSAAQKIANTDFFIIPPNE